MIHHLISFSFQIVSSIHLLADLITSHLLAVPFLADREVLFERLRAYVEDLSENTTTQLWVYFILGFGVFLGRQYWIFYKIRKAVSSLPMTIGGWGTRGKSGTERKKAALFHALGYDTFSKTTGCEAMFLHSTSEKRPAEIFLYRPYDKASIWEMGNTARLAANLGVDVYLWECMALNPRFVRLLQKGWMKDHLSTITNTYPDHEDVQGPAGIDIPRVMTEFLPPGRPAFTSEDQMLPILRDAARRQNTTLFEVSWRESAMLTKDVLDRFPYKVHPRNLALVLQLAEYFSIDKDFALKGMADHIVPDLGVLKTYPVANVEGRRLEFSNGMSANERRGFNDSWRRAGHASHSDEKEPGTWIVTVVNNRADRIPRSQVFAEVVVADAFAHKHVLIGTNLNGLLGYIKQALERHLAAIDLYSTAPSGSERAEVARNSLVERLKELKAEALSAEAVARKTAMLFPEIRDFDHMSLKRELEDSSSEELPATFRKAIEESSFSEERREEVIKFFSQWRVRLQEIERLFKMINEAKDPEAETRVNEAFRDFSRELFLSKVYVVEDSNATGEEIILQIAKLAPPGFFVRIMGMQNIKGTGLDFVYRWVALERVVEAAKQLTDQNEKIRMEAVDFFAYFEKYDVVTRPIAIEAIRSALKEPFNQGVIVRQKLEFALRMAESSGSKEIKKESANSSADWLLRNVEILLESGDSKRRRRKADLVLKDLVRKTISHERAAAILRDVTVRQKGGWLKKYLSEIAQLRSNQEREERPS